MLVIIYGKQNRSNPLSSRGIHSKCKKESGISELFQYYIIGFVFYNYKTAL